MSQRPIQMMVVGFFILRYAISYAESVLVYFYLQANEFDRYFLHSLDI